MQGHEVNYKIFWQRVQGKGKNGIWVNRGGRDYFDDDTVIPIYVSVGSRGRHALVEAQLEGFHGWPSNSTQRERMARKIRKVAWDRVTDIWGGSLDD